MSGDVNETPADRAERYYAYRPKSNRCPHCHSRAKLIECISCTRDMCEDCISYDARGPICGLCYDRAKEPLEVDPNIPF